MFKNDYILVLTAVTVFQRRNKLVQYNKQQFKIALIVFSQIMTSSGKLNLPNGSSTAFLIDFIMNAKQKFPDLPRQTQYLAVSILTKFLKLKGNDFLKGKSTSKLTTIGLTFILLASKFNDTHSLKISNILSSTSFDDLTAEEIRNQQAAILDQLDFEIPVASAYTGLQEYVNNHFEQKCHDRQNHLKALKFLKQTIKIFVELSLDLDFGKEIGSYIYERKSCQRIKTICAVFRKQFRGKGNNQNLSKHCQAALVN